MNKYNKRYAGCFGRKNASKKYLDPVGLSMKTTPSETYGENVNLLNPQEEFDLFTALHFIRFKIAKCQDKRLRKLLLLYKALRNRVISANIGLIYTCQRKVISNNADMSGIGITALMNTVERFNPWLGYKFSTYACRAILQELWKQANRRQPTQMSRAIRISTEQETVTEDAELKLYLERLKQMLQTNGLSNVEKLVIQCRFKGNDGQGMTLDDTGVIIGVSGERVRQIQNKALKKLKNRFKHDHVLNGETFEQHFFQQFQLGLGFRNRNQFPSATT